MSADPQVTQYICGNQRSTLGVSPCLPRCLRQALLHTLLSRQLPDLLLSPAHHADTQAFLPARVSSENPNSSEHFTH